MLSGQSISELSEDDLPELRRFLIAGFGVPQDSPCFAEDVLRWKYLRPFDGIRGLRSLVARHDGRIAGHIGLCPRELVVHGKGPAARFSTVHFMDWLALPDQPSAGLMLMLRACKTADTQYAVGGSADGQKMATTLGYKVVDSVDVHTAVLSGLYRLRRSKGGIRTYLGAAKDLGKMLLRPAKPPTAAVVLQPVSAFTDEINAVLQNPPAPMVFSSRDASVLNYYLQYPRGSISGWTIHAEGRLIGFALLSVAEDGSIRAGRIVDCFLATDQEDWWHSAAWSLVGQLKAMSADLVTCYASTGWLRTALARCGFYPQFKKKLYLRDKQRLVPAGAMFHVGQLEADHAYL